MLALVAVLTAFVNPLYIWSSIGWYLSFTAFFGILVLAPLLKKRFLSEKRQEKILPTVLVETVSAQLLTLPIILYIFGRLSVIGIVANVLVVPLVPFGMLFSLFSGIAGMVNFVLSGLFALPARLLLGYMLSVSKLLSKVPYANIAVSITAIQMIILYILMVVLIVLLHIKVKNRHDTITE